MKRQFLGLISGFLGTLLFNDVALSSSTYKYFGWNISRIDDTANDKRDIIVKYHIRKQDWTIDQSFNFDKFYRIPDEVEQADLSTFKDRLSPLLKSEEFKREFYMVDSHSVHKLFDGVLGEKRVLKSHHEDPRYYLGRYKIKINPLDSIESAKKELEFGCFAKLQDEINQYIDRFPYATEVLNNFEHNKISRDATKILPENQAKDFEWKLGRFYVHLDTNYGATTRYDGQMSAVFNRSHFQIDDHLDEYKKLLLARIAPNYQSPLDIAIRNGTGVELINRFKLTMEDLSYAPLNPETLQLPHPLHYAIRANNMRVVDKIVSYGSNFNLIETQTTDTTLRLKLHALTFS